MTSPHAALRPLDETDGLLQTAAPLSADVRVRPSDRTVDDDGSTSTVHAAAAVIGAAVALLLRKVR